MEADDAGFLAVFEVAGDDVADHRLQFFESIGFRENRKGERARLIAAFRGFLHGEDDFALGHVCYPSLIIRRFAAETRALCKHRSACRTRRFAHHFRAGHEDSDAPQISLLVEHHGIQRFASIQMSRNTQARAEEYH